LRPTILDDVGLPAALEWIATEHQQTYGTPVEVAGSMSRPLPSPQEAALFRIAQEALTNVGKHAGASRVQIRLAGTGPTVTLCVEDDGEGFDPARAARPAPNGCLGLS